MSQYGLGGILRNGIEYRIVKVLKDAGISFEYETALQVKPGKRVYPTFTISGSDWKVFIEIVNSDLEYWKEGFVEKMNAIKDAEPSIGNYKMIVMTYSDNVATLREFSELKSAFENIEILSVKHPEEDLIADRVEGVTNLDYCHFIPWHDGKCSAYHAHSSKIVNVSVEGYADIIKSWVIDYGVLKPVVKEVTGIIDHKTIVARKYIESIAGGLVKIVYDGKCGHHELLLPEKEVHILDDDDECHDSSSENLCRMLAGMILKRMPPNVLSVSIRFYEGMNNSSEGKVSRETTGEDISKLAEMIKSMRYSIAQPGFSSGGGTFVASNQYVTSRTSFESSYPKYEIITTTTTAQDGKV